MQTYLLPPLRDEVSLLIVRGETHRAPNLCGVLFEQELSEQEQ